MVFLGPNLTWQLQANLNTAALEEEFEERYTKTIEPSIPTIYPALTCDSKLFLQTNL